MQLSAELLRKISDAPDSMLSKLDDFLSGRMEVPKSANVEVDIQTLTITEAARMSRLSRSTMMRLVDDGRVPSVRFYGGRKILRRGLVDFLYANYNQMKGKSGLSVPLV